MKKVVISIDSFKGSLSSVEAGESVREGIIRAFPDTDVTVLPLADGGEGTVKVLTAGMGGELCDVNNPLCGENGASLIYGPQKGAEECNSCGIDAFFPIVRGPISLEQAMDPDTARKNLCDTAEQVFRIMNEIL